MSTYKAGLLGAAAVAVLTLWVANQINAQNGGPTDTDEITTAETTTVETTAAVETEPTEFETTAEGMRIFTLEDLAYYNGTNGRPVYVAYKGIVYDVSNAPQWRGGQHHGHTAGGDFTQILQFAPHGEGILRTFPVVGVLAE